MRSVLVVLALALAACGDPTGGPVPLTGKWTTPRVDILENVTYDVTDNGGTLSGTWSGHMTCYVNAAQRCEYNGRIAGSRSGNDLTITMEPVSFCGHGNYELAVTVNGNTANGLLYYRDCAGRRTVFSLPVTLSRE